MGFFPFLLLLILMFPYKVEGKGDSRPIGTLVLCGVFMAVYLMFAVWSSRGDENMSGAIFNIFRFGVFPAGFSIYTPITSLFLHADIFHVLFNLFFLWLFGACMERRIGILPYLGLFFAFGFVSNLGYLYMNPEYLSHIPSIGSSGAIAGVMGFVALTEPAAMLIFFSILPPHRLKLPAMLFLIVWFAGQLVSGFDEFGRVDPEGYSVNYWVHIFGFISGVLAGLGYWYFIFSHEKVKEIKSAQSIGKILELYKTSDAAAVKAKIDDYLKTKKEITEQERAERIRALFMTGAAAAAESEARTLCDDAMLTKDDDSFMLGYVIMESLCRVDPMPPEYLRAAGLIYAARGNLAKSLACRLRIIEQQADVSIKEKAYWHALDMLVRKMNNVELARKGLQFYLKAFPGGTFAKDAEFILTRTLPQVKTGAAR